ncbi:ArgS-related anticodon-binding protein NrtL [Streptomyces sp. NPDC008163]|uniref:ArgS-related anticodon-binding protein NrtL n=1 Tax=Streptomyces sp. NPDC008163 TaxID=3364818 RepID=UPI0036EFE8EE
MTPVDLSTTVLRAVRRAVREDALRAPVPARVRVERTRPGGRGDYASAVALQLAGPAGLGAREVAEILRDRLAGAPGVAGVEITGPGFLNFTLDAATGAAAHRALVHRVREQGPRYGYGDELAGQRLCVVHAREVRAAVTADAVRRLLSAQGADVRVGCEGEPDPDWTRLGVRTEAPGAQAEAPIRPVPAGETAATLLARLGPDAARWGLLRVAGHDRAPLGPELIAQTEANSLFRVRYAHARARAVVREAARLGVAVAGPGEDIDAPGAAAGPRRDVDATGAAAGPGRDVDATASTAGPSRGIGATASTAGPRSAAAEASTALLALLDAHPAALAGAARHRAPDRLARHLDAVAGAFFDFHDAAPPLPAGDEKPSAAHRSRTALAEAAGTVLAGGLSLLGVSAPEHL